MNRRVINPRILAYAMLCHECVARKDDDAAVRSLVAADNLYWLVMTDEERDAVLMRDVVQLIGS